VASIDLSTAIKGENDREVILKVFMIV